ncbi:hypothetical protein C8R46DRAFT_1201639 [Mycena filopes]|nr:hypothetical protein C8R46DRAFT_1201639 [Mycena filopes]
MSKLLSNFLVGLGVHPTPPSAPDDTSNDDEANSSDSDDSEVVADDELLALLREHMPHADVGRRIINLAAGMLRQRNWGGELSEFWRDVLRHVPADGIDATSEEVWLSREIILAALLARRQKEHGSGGTAATAVHTTGRGVVLPGITIKEPTPPPAPAAAVRTPSPLPAPAAAARTPSPTPPPEEHDGCILPGNASALKRSFLHHLAPSNTYNPRPLCGSYNVDWYDGARDAGQPALLPPIPHPEAARALETHRPLGAGEFAMRMILPEAYQKTSLAAHFPVAAIFVPKADDIACGMVETPVIVKPEVKLEDDVKPVVGTQHIRATLIPQTDMSPALLSLGARIAAYKKPPGTLPKACPVHVASSSPLPSTPEGPLESLDNIWEPSPMYNAPSAARVHERLHRAVLGAVHEVKHARLLRPGEEWSMKVAYVPEVHSTGVSVLFVPDDRTVKAGRTDDVRTLMLHDSQVTKMGVREVERTLKDGYEVLGGHKRKRAGWGGEEEETRRKKSKWVTKMGVREVERTLKDGYEVLGGHKRKRAGWGGEEEETRRKKSKWEGLGKGGREWVVQHSLFDMAKDDVWVGQYRRLGNGVGV